MFDLKDKRSPERLLMRQGVGDIVRAAAEETVPSIRLERAERAIMARIRDLSAQEMPWAPRRRFVRVVLVAGLISGLFSFGASAYFIYSRYFGVNAESEKTEVSGNRNGGIGERAFNNTRTGEPLQVTEDIESQQGEEETEYREGSDEGTDSPAHRNRSSKKSVLDKQLALFKAAKRLADKGSYRLAVSKLDALDSQYPEGPFNFESRELKAQCLFHMGSLAPAERLVQALVTGSRSNRKKAELMRFLGDIQVRLGRCDKAVKSYRRALGLGLRSADSKAAQNGISTCSQND